MSKDDVTDFIEDIMQVSDLIKKDHMAPEEAFNEVFSPVQHEDSDGDRWELIIPSREVVKRYVGNYGGSVVNEAHGLR